MPIDGRALRQVGQPPCQPRRFLLNLPVVLEPFLEITVRESWMFPDTRCLN
jgi:hypothetical protein